MRGSDSIVPAVGYATLCRVAEIRSREVVAQGRSRGSYAPDTLERLRVVMVDGEERDLFVRTDEYAEGYACDVVDALPESWGVDARGVLLPEE